MSRRTRRPRPTDRRAPEAGCPCGLPADYAACCGRLHRGEAAATGPEELMRSRFSAFAVQDEAYLLRSWHPDTRPPAIAFDPDLRWRRLEILDSTDGGAFRNEGTVEFRAHYTAHGRPGELHENSRFTRREGAWVYVDGVVSDG
ncbi:YchJ family protein [Streptomyces sp. NPDC018031]|uniref:YchJ family protein n=1 Tax=Streptomyces sp. NPDC018031 TaxID=3365033 RepID=UPI0037A2C828